MKGLRLQNTSTQGDQDEGPLPGNLKMHLGATALPSRGGIGRWAGDGPDDRFDHQAIDNATDRCRRKVATGDQFHLAGGQAGFNQVENGSFLNGKLLRFRGGGADRIAHGGI